jgi:trimeric autotransporter adhesin
LKFNQEKKMKKLIQIILSIIIIINIQIHSQSVPTTINYQGLLKDAAGAVVPDGDYNLTFKIYNAASGETAIWTETKTININSGIINTHLGSITPLNLPFDAGYWLGITIGAETELTPRVQFSSVPYSHMSMSVPNGTLTSEKIAGGQVVKSINSLKDNVNLIAGSNITITPSGSNITISSGGGTGLTLPFNGVVNIPDTTAITLNHIAATGTNYGLLSSINSSSGAGVYGKSQSSSGSNMGVMGSNSSLNGIGVLGLGAGNGVAGIATDPSALTYGVQGISYSTIGVGVYGLTTATTNVNYGGYFTSASSSGIGVYGLSSATTGTTYGGRFQSSSTSGRGVYGITNAATGTTYGVYGLSSSTGGRGVFGFSNALTGTTYGVYGSVNSPSGIGIYGSAPSYGIEGRTTNTTGVADGVRGISNSTSGTGVFGAATNTGTNYGGYFQSFSPSGTGVYGVCLSTAGTGIGYGVYGKGNANSSGAGVFGESPYIGVRGNSIKYGVVGHGSGSSYSYGIYGTVGAGTTNYAGYFEGNVNVTGTISKGGGSFKIDHPLDPENKYLYHSFVESPDMMNIYNGNVITDVSGYATVSLPDWFDALNKDFRYQLTVIGDFAQAIIAREVQGNQFVIRTDKPNVKVSWQVTGIRKDAFADKYRIPVEEEKLVEEKGKYIHPEAFGLSRSLGIDQNSFGKTEQMNEAVRTDIIEHINDIQPDTIIDPTPINIELPKYILERDNKQSK